MDRLALVWKAAAKEGRSSARVAACDRRAGLVEVVVRVRRAAVEAGAARACRSSIGRTAEAIVLGVLCSKGLFAQQCRRGRREAELEGRCGDAELRE